MLSIISLGENKPCSISIQNAAAVINMTSRPVLHSVPSHSGLLHEWTFRSTHAFACLASYYSFTNVLPVDDEKLHQVFSGCGETADPLNAPSWSKGRSCAAPLLTRLCWWMRGLQQKHTPAPGIHPRGQMMAVMLVIGMTEFSVAEDGPGEDGAWVWKGVCSWWRVRRCRQSRRCSRDEEDVQGMSEDGGRRKEGEAADDDGGGLYERNVRVFQEVMLSSQPSVGRLILAVLRDITGWLIAVATSLQSQSSPTTVWPQRGRRVGVGRAHMHTAAHTGIGLMDANMHCVWNVHTLCTRGERRFILP